MRGPAHGIAAALLAIAAAPTEAHAYRPFDGTDAAVADKGAVEVEIGPAQWLYEPPSSFLVAPALILNLGVTERWEVVAEGQHLVHLSDSEGGPRQRLVDPGLFLKGVLRAGTLQEGTGPSVATEVGILLPTIRDESGIGAEATLIASQRWPAVTVHVNGGLALTRGRHFGVMGSLIVEAPSTWPVRPVAEAFFEREVSVETVWSGLLGAIWRAGPDLAFDIGARRGAVGGARVTELRAGLTWAFKIL